MLLLVILFFIHVWRAQSVLVSNWQFHLEVTIHQIEKDRERSFLVICAIERCMPALHDLCSCTHALHTVAHANVERMPDCK
jgi:hypothetical protein